MIEAAATGNTRKANIKKEVWEWLKFIIAMLIVVSFINKSIGFTKVIGNSMNPSLSEGNILFINKISTYFSKPDYGDVVIIKNEDLGHDIVKRVIAVEGDLVEIVDGIVYVNSEQLLELYTAGIPYDMAETVVDKGHIFILGDNRTPGESFDSRNPYMGTVPVKDIKGYALISVYPFHKILKPINL